MSETAKSTRGAPKLHAPAPLVEMDSELARQDMAVFDAEHARQQEAVRVYGDGLPWVPEHYEAEIRGALRTGCEAFLRAGRLLAVARECAAHGEWLGMLERLGIESRQAQRMVDAAKRMSNASTSTHLTKAIGTQSKLIELLSLPDDQFAELAETGKTGDLGADEIANMSTRELRIAVRKARQKAESADADLSHANAEIAETKRRLNAANRHWARATPDEQIKSQYMGITGVVLEILSLITSRGAPGAEISSLRERMAELITDPGIDRRHDLFIAGKIAEIERELHVLRDEFYIPHDCVGDPRIEAERTLGQAL